MSIAITINSVDRTNEIEQQSLRYQQTLSKAPATLKFKIIGEKSVPSIGDSVLLTQDSQNFFKGTITHKNEYLVNQKVRGYEFICTDGYYNLNRRLVIKAYNDTTVGAIIEDIVTNYTSGFSTDMPDVTPTVETVRFNYEQPSRCIQKLVDAIGWDWKIDANDVVTVFIPDDVSAPYEINDTDGNHIAKTLEFDRNIIELKNVVYVRGGEYNDPIAEGDAVDKYEANGVDNTFPLVYRYANTEVTVNGSPQDVGVDFIDDISEHDCLYNYQEKLVRFPDGTLSDGDVVRVFGDAKVPVIVLGEDTDSVAAYGTREGVEINKSLNSIEEAEQMANSVLQKWREGSLEGRFKSYKTGWEVGQTVIIDSDEFGVTESYKINRVSASLHGHDSFIFTVEFIKSGQTEFTDLLIGLIGKEKDNITISDNEVLQRYRSVLDTFGMTDEIVSVDKVSGPYGYGTVSTKTEAKYSFSTYS